MLRRHKDKGSLIKKLDQFIGDSQYLHTGSCVFDLQHSGSDIDIVLSPDQEGELDKWKELFCDIHKGDYSEDGFYTYRIHGTKYNIIQCLEEETFYQWVDVTQIFKILCRDKEFKGMVRNKKRRIEIFTNLMESWENKA